MQYKFQALLTALVLAPGALASFLNVKNNCDFPVYCMGTRSNEDVGDATEIVEVAEGDSWTSPLESMDVSIIHFPSPRHISSPVHSTPRPVIQYLIKY